MAKTSSFNGNTSLAEILKSIDWRRVFFILLGLGLFALVYFSPPWGNAIDPAGKPFVLTHEGKAAIGLFLLAAVWWVFEVVPIGVTSLAIGVVQCMFLIRDPRVAFTDFMDPSVMFIFGSVVIGMVFSKTGLTRRMAYKMLSIVGERTSMIYLGCFLMTSLLTLIMAHTAVAATVFPLLMAINSLYEEDDAKQTRFGKGLFIGMAYVAGAGSIITLLGAARGAVAIGFFKQVVGIEIGFFQLSYYLLPVGAVMVGLLWLFFMYYYKPERATIPGLKEQSRSLYNALGPMTYAEKSALTLVMLAILFLSLRSFIPALEPFNKSAVILITTIAFFLFKILDVKDLEGIPWNIILLFGGAMSVGFCLWQTGAANWMAVQWLGMFQHTPSFVFIMSIAFMVLMLTNGIMNVAAIAISMPVALVIAEYLGVAPEVIMFASLVTAGMPFLFLIGAAPNAIAYESRQFTSGEFFRAGVWASLILMVVLGLFVAFIWPLMGMPVKIPGT